MVNKKFIMNQHDQYFPRFPGSGCCQTNTEQKKLIFISERPFVSIKHSILKFKKVLQKIEIQLLYFRNEKFYLFQNIRTFCYLHKA